MDARPSLKKPAGRWEVGCSDTGTSGGHGTRALHVTLFGDVSTAAAFSVFWFSGLLVTRITARSAAYSLFLGKSLGPQRSSWRGLHRADQSWQISALSCEATSSDSGGATRDLHAKPYKYAL